MSYLNEHNLTRNDKFRCICRWNESIEIMQFLVSEKKIFNYLIHTHILVVIIITSQRMTFLSWEFRCCEKEKNNRSIIFDMLVLSQICWFFFSSLVLFISYKIIWHFHRQTIVSENWNGFVDRKSPFFGWREDAQCEVTYTNLGWERSEGKPIIRVRTKSNLRLRESSEITSTTLKNHYY